jgi:hypothetical protein
MELALSLRCLSVKVFYFLKQRCNILELFSKRIKVRIILRLWFIRRKLLNALHWTCLCVAFPLSKLLVSEDDGSVRVISLDLIDLRHICRLHYANVCFKLWTVR